MGEKLLELNIGPSPAPALDYHFNELCRIHKLDELAEKIRQLSITNDTELTEAAELLNKLSAIEQFIRDYWDGPIRTLRQMLNDVIRKRNQYLALFSRARPYRTQNNNLFAQLENKILNYTRNRSQYLARYKLKELGRIHRAAQRAKLKAQKMREAGFEKIAAQMEREADKSLRMTVDDLPDPPLPQLHLHFVRRWTVQILDRQAMYNDLASGKIPARLFVPLMKQVRRWLVKIKSKPEWATIIFTNGVAPFRAWHRRNTSDCPKAIPERLP